MSVPDLELCRCFLQHRPPPGAVLLCAVTGSHHYGFSSPDSDLDIKGIHQRPTEQMLGMTVNPENHDALEIFAGVECDLTTNELSQALRLLVRGNGNLLERIHSPFQVVDTPWVGELRALAVGARSKASFGHYRGYLAGMQREHLREDPPRAKSLLYSFRVALTGIHLLESHEVVANLPTLAPEYGYPDVLELVAFKRQAGEKDGAPTSLAQRLRAMWPALEARLDQARERSTLPETAPNVNEIEAWLIERRRAGFVEPPPT